jgi:hypothetical protein
MCHTTLSCAKYFIFFIYVVESKVNGFTLVGLKGCFNMYIKVLLYDLRVVAEPGFWFTS